MTVEAPVIKPEIKLDDRIGIIAGGGALPKQLIESCKAKNITPYLVALNDITDKETTEGVETIWARIGSVGRIINFFEDNQVKQIVLAGWVKRPSFSSLIPDTMGIKLLNAVRNLDKAGDNSVFDIIIKFLEEQDLTVLGVDSVVTDLVAAKGIIGKTEPHKKEFKDIAYGAHVAAEIGKLDIGQAVIVQNGMILGVEGIDGTDALIKRCKDLQLDGHGAVLVKMKKPKQDRRIDLPSIGIQTVIMAYEAKLKGIAVEAGNSLIIGKEETIKKADELGIFIFGI